MLAGCPLDPRLGRDNFGQRRDRTAIRSFRMRKGGSEPESVVTRNRRSCVYEVLNDSFPALLAGVLGEFHSEIELPSVNLMVPRSSGQYAIDRPASLEQSN